MQKKLLSFLVLALFGIAGCATTGRNYQADIDSLNARFAAVQGQLTAKDEEIARLEAQLRQEEAATAKAEADKRLLLQQLQENSSKKANPNTAAAPDSDLK